ncbi:MAG: hypothetical protein JXR19_08260, partial [Bacteroidia bacterium]
CIQPPTTTAATLATGGIGVNNKGGAAIVGNPALTIFQTKPIAGIHGSNLFGLSEYSSIAAHALYNIGKLRAGNMVDYFGTNLFKQTSFYQSLALKLHTKTSMGIFIGIRRQSYAGEYTHLNAIGGLGTTHKISEFLSINWCSNIARNFSNSHHTLNVSSELGIIYAAEKTLNIHLLTQIANEGFTWNIGLEFGKNFRLFYTAKSRQLSAGYSLKFSNIQTNLGLSFHQFLGTSQALSIQYEST